MTVHSDPVEHRPAHIDEVEALLGTDFFYDEARSTALYEEGLAGLADEQIGARRCTYIGALAVLAHARADERQMAQANSEAERYTAREWNAVWRLTPQRLGAIATQYVDDVQRLARPLAMLNNFEQAVEEQYAQQGLLEHQPPYVEGIIEGLRHGSQKVILPDWWKGNEEYYIPGVTVTGPTGIGKTAIMARTAMALGAGKPPKAGRENRESDEPIRILTVTPSQGLIAQMTGKVGKGIFGTLAPGLHLGAYYQQEHVSDADVVFATVDMFIARFRDGMLDGTPFDAIFIDEVQHLTEPQFLTTFLHNWNGLAVGFSATPSYNPTKDARNILRYEVEHGNVLEYAGRVLNGLQAYSLLVYPEDVGVKDTIASMTSAERRIERQRATCTVTRDFLLPLLAEGRRGIVFCEPGYESAHALQLSGLLDGMTLADGRVICAATLGSFQGSSDSPENRQLIQNYNEGKIDVLTTTQMGQEALDFNEVNFVGNICKTTSTLKTYQMAGRGARKSKRFKNTILFNVNTLGFGQSQYYAKTFASVLAGDTIEQGVVVRQLDKEKKPTRKVAQDPITFTNQTQTILNRINHKTMAEAYFVDPAAEEVTVPPNYTSLDKIIANKEIEAKHARYQLLRAGYKFVGRSEQHDGATGYVRYYEPAAKTYFTAQPQPPEDGLLLSNLHAYIDDIVTVDMIAARLKLNKKVLTHDYLTKEEFTALKKVRYKGNITRCWEREEAEQILARLKKILIFPAHRIPFGYAAKRLKKDENTVRELIKRKQDELGITWIERGNRKYPSLSWRTLEYLEKRYGRRDDVTPIRFEDMPDGTDDDAEKIAYARMIQRECMPPHWLPEFLSD